MSDDKFKCNICYKKYANASGLRKHRKTNCDASELVIKETMLQEAVIKLEIETKKLLEEKEKETQMLLKEKEIQFLLKEKETQLLLEAKEKEIDRLRKLMEHNIVEIKDELINVSSKI